MLILGKSYLAILLLKCMKIVEVDNYANGQFNATNSLVFAY